MTIEARLAEVLAEHGGFEFDTITNPKTVTCFCQKWQVKWERDAGYDDAAAKVDAAFWGHQASVLAGVVREAQAKILRWAYTYSVCDLNRHDTDSDWLRDLADRIEAGE